MRLIPLFFLLLGCAAVPEPVSVPEVQTPTVVVGPSPVNARQIGLVYAEPGDPDNAGAWVQLVGLERPVDGWVTDLETGTSAQVELRPAIEDAQFDTISIDALRALGIAAPRLVILDVYYDRRGL